MRFKRVIPKKMTKRQEAVWQRSGDIGQPLNSKTAITFGQALEEIRLDTTNYRFGPKDGELDDRSSLPMPGTLAIQLIDLIEHDLVKVVK